MPATEQPVDERRALDEITHKQEQRDRDQHVVRHHAVGALHHDIEDLLAGDRRVHAAVGEPAEEHAQAHQRERGRKAEHDRHDDQREHQQAEVGVGDMAPGHEHHDGGHDDRHKPKAEPEFLAPLHLPGSWRTTNWSSFAMSSSLTWTIFFSSSTSTSWTSTSREGHSPCLRQIAQRMISTTPCTSTNAPATGMMVLNG